MIVNLENSGMAILGAVSALAFMFGMAIGVGLYKTTADSATLESHSVSQQVSDSVPQDD